MDQLPRLGKRELICLLSFTCNYVVFVWRGFFFLWVLGMGYVILLWHSLSLPYNYFVDYLFCFRPPNRLFFRLKNISVVSSIRHSARGNIQNMQNGLLDSTLTMRHVNQHACMQICKHEA